MELSIIKKEKVGYGSNNASTESEILTTYEVMDGGPRKGEIIPIRFYLSSTNITPTHKNINNKFTCRYFMNLVLIDEEDRRYFK